MLLCTFHGRYDICLVKPEEAFAELEKKTGKVIYKQNKETAEEQLENLGNLKSIRFQQSFKYLSS